MPAKKPTKPLNTEQVDTIRGLFNAKDLAAKLFGIPPVALTSEMLYGVYWRCVADTVDDRDPVECFEKTLEVAREIFGVERPPVEGIFDTFDELFAVDPEDEADLEPTDEELEADEAGASE